MAAPSSATGSLWQTVLEECTKQEGFDDGTANVESHVAGANNFRVILCGNVMSGKRLIATRMRERAGEKHKFTGGRSHGGGVEHTFVEVQGSEEGAPTLLIEFFCCDTPSVIPVALPTVEYLKKSVILFVLDLSDPLECPQQLANWREALNTHVASLLTAAAAASQQQQPTQRHSTALLTAQALYNERKMFWDVAAAAMTERRNEYTKEFSSSMPEATASVLAAKQVVQDITPLLPSIVVLNKMDVFEKQKARYSGNESSIAPGVNRKRFAWEFFRREALQMGAGFVALSAKSQSLNESFFEGLWAYILQMIENLRHPSAWHKFYDKQQQRHSSSHQSDATSKPGEAGEEEEEKGAPSELILPSVAESSVSMTVEENHSFIPHGLDLITHLSPQVTGKNAGKMWQEMFAWKSSGDVPEVRLHEDVIVHDAKFPVVMVWDE